MAAFRLYSKTRTWFGSTGQLLAGGHLKFFATDGTTPQNVFGEKALTTNNGSQIALDASGRLVFDVWADTTSKYFVEVYNSAGVKQGEENNVEVPGGTGQVVPVPLSGEFLTGDGVSFLTESLSTQLLPDQTGHANKILGTDGSTAAWVVKPADGAAGVSDISTTATSFRVGNKLTQLGTGSAPASGSETTTATVTFPVAFSAAPSHISLTVKDITTVSGSALVAHSVTGVSTTGFTVNFNIADRHFVDGTKITVAVPFTYKATGAV